LLEVLQLSEEENNAFLAKYSTYDNKISESMQLIFELSQNLKKEIKDNSKPEEISKLTSQLIAEQKKLDDLRNENLIEMGKVLSKEAYPKFVYFELNFQQEVMREIMKNRERPDQDGDKPKRRMRFNQD